MKKLLIFIPIVFTFFMSSFTLHEFYTSMTKVEYNLASRTIKISTKIDVDHLEAAIGTKVNASNFDKVLSAYINSHIKVKVNDKAESLVFGSSNPSGEVIWIYYNIQNIDKINTLEITNTLLFDKYNEQQNFINFSIDGKRESYISKKGSATTKKSF